MKTGTCHSRLIHSVVTVCTSLILQGLFCSPSARAEDFSAVNSDNKIIYYNTTSSTTVEVVNGTYTGDLVIPESVIYNGNTYSVTVINNAFNGCSALTSVIIPNSVTDIESKAFRGCTALTSVTIGSSVTFIAPDAFDSCNGSTLTAIYVKAQTPPSAAGAAGNMTNINNVTVHVPCGKAEDYKNWGGFSKITADISPYSITAQSSYPPAGTAAVTKVPNCADNTAVITATPSTGYRFVRWNDGSTSASRTVTVTQDVTYTAIFEMLSAAVTTPGGVNNSNYTWYAWLTPDSYNGSGTWVNNIVGSSSIGNFVKENIAPAKLNTGYNFHPSVEFKKGGSDTWMQSENYHVIGNDHNVTVFIVMRHLGTGGDYDYLLSFYKDTYQNRQFIFTSSSNLRLYWPGTSHNFTFKEGIFALDNTNNSNTTGMASYVNGAAQNLQASGRSNNGTDNKLAIGSRSGTLNYGFDGTIQELIVLKASGTGNHMEAADLRKIHSYLAIKYGITLNNTDNYVNSNGATVWTRTAGYNSQIFGIARDDASGLYQKQSQSIANTVFSAFVGSELYTHNANNNGHLDNGVYAMFGSNNASLNTTVTLATGLVIPGSSSSRTINYRKGPVYRAQLTGIAKQKVKLRFEMHTGGALPEYALVSTGATFASGSTQVVPVTITGSISTVEVELNAGENYITLGGHRTESGEGPGGVSGGLKLWLRADDPATIETRILPAGTGKLENYPDEGAGIQLPAVTQWKDLVHDITYDSVKAEGTGWGATKNEAFGNGYRLWPVYQPSNYMTNYHPALRFWGTNTKAAYLGSEDSIWQSLTTEKHSAFFVVNNDFGRNAWVYPMFFTKSGIGGWASPGYGVHKLANKLVGRFRTWTAEEAPKPTYDSTKYIIAGNVDLFKPGATSILTYHHKWINNDNPQRGDVGYVNFRFNGLDDNNSNNSNGGYPVIWNFEVEHPDYPGYQYDPYTDLRNRSLLGTGYDYDRTIQGVMSEVIMYDGALDPADLRKIESYLALKYGVTLTPGTASGKFDYVFSDDGMLWNGTAGGGTIWHTFYNRIAAVIRDDNSNLHNRQSHSTNVGSILHMGIAGTRLGDRADLGDFSSDKSAVIWGDNGDITGVTPVNLDGGCGDFDEVLNRKWLVHKRTNGKPLSMIVGAQNNTGNQLGTDIDAGTQQMFSRLGQGYSVYMIVADDPDDLTAANLPDGRYKAVVPMQYIDGEQQCTYTFADSITYITFGCKANGGCTGTAIFEGTKTFEWSQWTRQNYGSAINVPPDGVKKTAVDLGDGVEVISKAFYGTGVIAPANYPSVTNSPVAGSLYVQRQKGGYNNTATITIEMNTPVRPEFSIYDIDGYAGCFEKITVMGFCGNDGVLPTLSYGGDPATSFYRIVSNVATAVVRNDLSPTDKDGQLDISFQGGVTKVVIEYAITGNQQVTYTNNLVISPVHFRAVPPMPPVNEDGLSFVKDVAKREVTTCEPSVEYSFYIGNVNCDSKFVSLRDTLPEGLTWLSGIGTGSLKPVDDSHLKFNSYAGTRYLRIDSLDVPGAGTLRVTATVAIDTSVVKVGDIRDFDNHAWIRYKQIVMDYPVDSILKSLDRETLAEETSFTAIGTERPDTIRPSITTSVDKYSADSIIAVTVTVNNPNIDPVPMCYLDVRFDANFTYAGGFTSTSVSAPVPVALSQVGDSLLTVAGNTAGTQGFTIPSGISTWKFNLKAPKLDSLAKSTDANNDSIISPLRIEYIFSTETTDACLLLGMVAMDGTRELPYKSLIAHDDYVSTLTEMEAVIPVLANDSILSCTPEKEITAGPLHGDADFVNDSIRYTSDPGYTGNDTLTYRLVCDLDTSYANVYIYVAEKPDNISDDDCFTEPPATEWGIREVSVNSTNKVHNLGPLTAGDINGNDTVMIIGFMDNHRSNVNDGNHPTYGFKTFYFDRELQQIVQKDSIPFPADNRRVSTFSSMAIARYEGKGYIVVAGIDPCYLYAYESDGTPLWTSNNYYSKDYASYFATIINIVDFNHDGIPEVYTGNRIFSLETGELLCKDDNNNTGVLYHNGGDASMAADIVSGGNLELCAGTQIYSVNIPQGATRSTDGCSMSVITDMQLPTALIPSNASKDGATQVVDIDGDGALEVVVVTRHTAPLGGQPVVVYVWKPLPGNASQLIGSYTTPVNSDYYSLPMIGDIDGDSLLEIVYIGYGNSNSGPNSGRMYALDYLPDNAQGSRIAYKWQYNITDGSSATGMTLFDFNNDGIAEIVYRDETTLHIINGNAPNPPEASFPHVHSYTLREYPLIVDIDNDGQAEIVVAGGLTDADQHNGFIRVFKSDGSPWAPARKVWNQYAYNATNINEDLTVPRYPLNPATLFPGKDGQLGTDDDVRPYNNFRQQQTTLSTNGTPLWLTPDAAADATISSYTVLTDNLVAVRVGIINRGDAPLGPPVHVSLYRGFLSSQNFIARGSDSTLMINKGDTGYVTITVDMELDPVLKIVAQVNDNGSTYKFQPECSNVNLDNNTIGMTLIKPLLNNDMEKVARLLPSAAWIRGDYPNPVSILYGDTLEYRITAVNANIDSGTVIIRDTLPAYLRYVDDGTADWYHKSFYSEFLHNTIPGPPVRDTLMFRFDSLESKESVWATFRATPVEGVSASQPMFVNRAWITASDTLLIPTGNSTYHQGAGVSVVTFSAPAKGGDIYNATPQALDYRTSPNSGVLVVPDEGYAFAGWSHDAYTSLRGERIEARTGIVHYDTLTVYGNVELRAIFVPEEYPVRYHLHGGENPAANPPAYTVESAAVTLEAPSKANDVFTGWTGSNGDEPQPSVTIPRGSTGERDYYANYLHTGREEVIRQRMTEIDRIWASGSEAFIRTSRAGSIARIYTPDGILREQRTLLSAGTAKIRLDPGVYIITLNNGPGQKIIIEL